MISTPHVSTAHPWHGVVQTEQFPSIVTVFIEMVPTDVMKYEIDKASGILKIDRPQRFSNYCPAPYGFLPQTYSGPHVAAESAGHAQRGDSDPLDICILTERPILHGGILLYARPIGGLRLIDKGEADDKIVAVLVGDAAFGDVKTLSEVPRSLLDRLNHYFLTYKLAPGTKENPVFIQSVYEIDEALNVIRASRKDYEESFLTRDAF